MLDGGPRTFDTALMFRALALAALSWTLLGAEARSADAGRPDGGLADAGLVDGGVDAGLLLKPRVTASWTHADGGFLTDAGVSDRVVVPVGGTQEVRFPYPLISGQCDDQNVAHIDGTGDTLIFRGVVPGHTFCGFWFYRQAWPNRYVELTVVGEEEATPREAPRRGRPEFHR